jgi:hypothetical protein
MSTSKKKRRKALFSGLEWAGVEREIASPDEVSVKHTNPKDAAASTRIDLSLFPASARAYGALAMVEGDLKYGGFNYREMGVLASVYYAAGSRHLDKWFNGEDADPKTLVPHLASALACVAVLIDAVEQGNINDDRPPRQGVGVYDRFEANVAHLQKIFPRRAARYREK